MGMMDPQLLFSDHFEEDQVFSLEGAKLGPTVNTAQYGTAQTVLLKINGKVYSIIGQGIQSQVERMDADDKQAMADGKFRCKLVRVKAKSGNDVKVLRPYDWTPAQENGVGADDDIPF